SDERDVRKLLASFFAVDDANLAARYRFFYDQLAPHLELYRIRIGDKLTISAVTRNGYMRSASLRLYGTFEFQGLEGSPLAGTLNLMDLVSFRDLYGFMTAERAQEIAQLRAASGARVVTRERAEAELFGNPGADAPAQAADLAPRDLSATLASLRSRGTQTADHYAPAELGTGAILNAAVLVDDESRIAETAAAIERAAAEAGLPLKAISWQAAAGVVGQLASLMRGLLYAAMLIVFLVALVVISNALVMATLERVREIGTLRAIGAQKQLVLAILSLESLAVATLAGALGAAAGAALVAILGSLGIPASNEAMAFFFSGSRLYPQFGVSQLGFALGLVLVTSAASSIYPVWIAVRVSPREAMQTED
ncbi:MAG TPA: FtsX-like permease family protein, partial [Polyangiaceae bacterium]|nr:FtsX-like permease family protein [Polyangiaceae bacterium]